MQSMMRMLAGLTASAILGLAGCQTVTNVTDRPGVPPPPSVPGAQTPIIFVHGNGDTAALWNTTIWRFESNGYPRERLHAIDFISPQARSDDAKTQTGRSSTGDQLRDLSAFVDQVRKITGMEKVALVASSRGANVVRNFIRNGGDAVVSHALLAGGVNHGVYASASFNPGSEFNGSGPFMTALNAPYPDGSEVTPGVKWMTLRSDNFDKYAQPDGRFVGQPGMQTNVTFDGPALRGADNVVLPRADHREVAFGPAAFAEMFRFITGARPAHAGILTEEPVVLNGKVSGYLDGAPTNLPLIGASVTVYRVAADTGARMRGVPHQRVVGADGLWGPLAVDAKATLEFIIEADGYPITHIYRSPFPRSSDVAHLRPAAPGSVSDDDVRAGGAVVITRPRGYFGVGRDIFLIDGKMPPGVTDGVPGVSTARLRLPADPLRPVSARCNDETINVINRPASEGRIVFAEFNY
jgi:triacylglycerol lipase